MAGGTRSGSRRPEAGVARIKDEAVDDGDGAIASRVVLAARLVDLVRAFGRTFPGTVGDTAMDSFTGYCASRETPARPHVARRAGVVYSISRRQDGRKSSE
jgi:hypothetical protein